jgi:hypothetical protein
MARAERVAAGKAGREKAADKRAQVQKRLHALLQPQTGPPQRLEAAALPLSARQPISQSRSRQGHADKRALRKSVADKQAFERAVRIVLCEKLLQERAA